MIICLALGLAGGYAYYTLAPKVYEATATVLVLPTATGLDAGTSAASTEINMETEAELARSGSVASEVAQGLDEQVTSSELLAGGSVTIPPNSQVLQFTAQAPTAELAAEAANSWAQTYLDRRSERAKDLVGRTTESLLARYDAAQEELKGLGSDTGEFVQARRDVLIAKISDINKQLLAIGADQGESGTVISEADEPSAPAAPQLPRSLAAGLVLGAAAAVALILIGAARRRSDSPQRPATSERQIRVLASYYGLADDESDLEAEELRRACHDITSFVGDPGPLAMIGVANPLTTMRVTLHLGKAWASEVGRSVVVSTDPSTSEALPRAIGVPGLSDLLVDRATPLQCAIRVPGSSAVAIGSGREPTREAIPTHKLSTVWAQLEQELGMVMAATTSPESPVGEVVIHTAGRVVGVVRSGHHREQDLVEVLAVLDRLSASDRLVGVIIVDDSGGVDPHPGPDDREPAQAPSPAADHTPDVDRTPDPDRTRGPSNEATSNELVEQA